MRGNLRTAAILLAVGCTGGRPCQRSADCLAGGVCFHGACAACQAGYADCNGEEADGCETALATDPMNCGACGQRCGAIGTTPACQAGSCINVCSIGFADCNGNPADGCETDTRSDPTHCGDCTRPCVLAHAQPRCLASVCSVEVCEGGWGDCNGRPEDGCETELGSDAVNCGSCGKACSYANAVGRCQAGACSIGKCVPDYADCDGNAANGCEMDIAGDPANCGACGTSCDGKPHAKPACNKGMCTVACNAGFGDCNGVLDDGCEVDVTADAANCGGCGNRCAPSHGQGACVAGACTVAACSDGFADCDGDAANGCEAMTATDAANCGGCARPCKLANATPSCNSGACLVAACNAGYGDCDGDPANGCELATTSDPSNCGQCGHVCPAGIPCMGGVCAAFQDVWTPRFPVGSPSPARSGHAMAYDAARGTTVLFGGDHNGSLLADTWFWDGTTWTNAGVSVAPKARKDAAMVYDSRRHVMVLFGGNDLSIGCVPSMNTTWEFDGKSWSAAQVSGAPSARTLHQMAYDEARGVLVLFGGTDCIKLLDSTWEYDGKSWTQRTTTSSPPARKQAGMAYDAARKKIVLFGGVESSCSYCNDTWEYDGNDWKQIQPATSVPSPAAAAALAWDSARNVVVDHEAFLLQGSDGDTWEWDGSDWRKRQYLVDGLVAPIVYDVLRARVVLYSFGDTWVYGGP